MSVADAIAISVLPFLSFAFCAVLLVRSANHNRESKLLFLNLGIMSLAQTCSFMSWPYSEALLYGFADVYLIAGYWLFANILLFINTLSDNQLDHIRWVYVAPISLSVLHMAGLLTDGYRIENGSPMHNNGVLAWVGDAYLIMCLLGVGGIVVTNLKRNDSEVWVSKNWLFLLSLIPMMVGFSYVIVASVGPNPVSLVYIGPSVTLWAALTFYYLSRSTVANVSYGLRLFMRRLKLIRYILELDYSRENQRAIFLEIEKQSIRESLAKHGSNIPETAAALGWDHSTLRKKLKLHGLSRN